MSPRAACRLEQLGLTEVADYLGGIADWAAAGLPVEGSGDRSSWIGALANADVPTCALDDTIGAIRARLGAWETCFVVDEGRVVLGRLDRRDLVGLDERRAEAVMHLGPRTFRPNVPAEELLAKMLEHDHETAPVTTSDGRLVGLVFREDLTHAVHTADEEGIHRTDR